MRSEEVQLIINKWRASTNQMENAETRVESVSRVADKEWKARNCVEQSINMRKAIAFQHNRAMFEKIDFFSFA